MKTENFWQYQDVSWSVSSIFRKSGSSFQLFKQQLVNICNASAYWSIIYQTVVYLDGNSDTDFFSYQSNPNLQFDDRISEYLRQTTKLKKYKNVPSSFVFEVIISLEFFKHGGHLEMLP